jgi:hypothetical protein
MDLDKVNDAIRQCLKACQSEEDPIGSALRCIRELRKRPDWTEDEIIQVRNGVAAILRHI